MKKIDPERVRHGELDIRHIGTKAPDLAGYELEAGHRCIVGHSETGAVHCIQSPKAKMYRKVGAEIAYLCLEQPEQIEHAGQRHPSTALKAGWHEVVVKRQANADESWSPVAD